MSTLKAGAVLYVKEIARVRAFYEKVVGLSAVAGDDDHVVLESTLFQLVIHRVPASIAASIEISTPPKRRTETPIKLVFPVSSIASVRNDAVLYGGEFNPSEREWTFQGSQVCDGCDPEGNVVQVREVAR